MSNPRSSHTQQEIVVPDSASVAGSQIGGQAGRDLTVAQNQGAGNIFQGVNFYLFGSQGRSKSGENEHSDITRKAYRNRQALLNKVKRYWVEGVLTSSLYRQRLINIELEECPDAVASPWDTVNSFELDRKPLPANTKAIDVFDQMVEGRTLLILGEPGAGKTTLLLALAKELISRAELDVEHPIPVVFNLSAWTSGKLPVVHWFVHWLVDELSSKYQVPRKVGLSWIEDQRLLLLFDGLDEVQANHREACVTALNEFNQEYGPELVVCSRSKQYGALAHRLNVQTAICLQSLTARQIYQSFRFASSELDGLGSLLQQDQTIWELAESPLMLKLMMTACRGVKPGDLPQVDQVGGRRQQVFNAYIHQVFKHRSAHSPYTQSQTLYWLSWLAQRMSRFSQTVFLIENMQPDWLQSEAQQRSYWIILNSLLLGSWGSLHVGLLAGQVGYNITFVWASNSLAAGAGLLGGLAYGLIGGISNAPVTRACSPLVGRVLNGLMLAIIFGPIFGWVYGRDMYGIVYSFIYAVIGLQLYGLLHQQRIETVETLQWFWQKAIVSSVAGFAIGGALYLGTSNDLIPCLIFGLVLSLIFGFESRDEVDSKTRPNQGLWKSVTNSGRLFVTLGSFTGLLIGTFVALSGISNLNTIWVNALLFGVASALLGGKGSGIVCFKHFVLRIILWRRGYIPWNYARFLNDAAERNLLQKVGGGYVFVHRALLEHFAALQVPAERF